MRILITGANGFLGQSVVSRLARRHEIVAAVRGPHQAPRSEGVSSVVMDLAGPLDFNVLPERLDVIVHLAQANVRFPEAAGQLLAVNTMAAQQLLEYARSFGVRRVVLASTGDVYGQRVGRSRETDPIAPTSFYALTKQAAEMLACAYSAYLEPCILRLFQPYGPGQINRLIPKLANRIRNHQTIELHRDGPHVTPIFIDDVSIAIERAIECSYTGAVNVAGDEAVSMRELAEEIGRVVEVEPVFSQTEQDQGDLMGDNSLMKQVFGVWPLVELSDGLSRTFIGKEDTRWRAHL